MRGKFEICSVTLKRCFESRHAAEQEIRNKQRRHKIRNKSRDRNSMIKVFACEYCKKYHQGHDIVPPTTWARMNRGQVRTMLVQEVEQYTHIMEVEDGDE